MNSGVTSTRPGRRNRTGRDKRADEANDFATITSKRKIIDARRRTRADETTKGRTIDRIPRHGRVDGRRCTMIETNDDRDDGTSSIGARGRRWANGTSGTSVNAGEGTTSETKIGRR